MASSPAMKAASRLISQSKASLPYLIRGSLIRDGAAAVSEAVKVTASASEVRSIENRSRAAEALIQPPFGLAAEPWVKQSKIEVRGHPRNVDDDEDDNSDDDCEKDLVDYDEGLNDFEDPLTSDEDSDSDDGDDRRYRN